MKRAALYIRVSDRRQVRGVSLEDQERACREYAAREGMPVVQVYIEPGRSAYTEDLRKRIAFNELVAAARKRQFDVVIVYKMDRFARKVRVQYNAAAELESLGVDIKSATEYIDRKTAAGRQTFGFLAVASEAYSDQLSERMRDTRAAEVRRGKLVGPVPVGYVRFEGQLKPSADAPAVKLAFRLYATGQHSFKTIAAALNEDGWTIPSVRHGERRRWSKAAVDEVLRNPTYIGKVRLKGQVFDGLHEPIIDQELWDEVQRVLKRRAGRRGPPPVRKVKESEGTLIDLAYCALCGSRMTYCPRNRSRSKGYYACSAKLRDGSCQAKMVRSHAVDDQLLAIMRQITIPAACRSKLIEKAVELTRQPRQPVVATDDIDAALRRLRMDFVDERISDEEYKHEKARLEGLKNGAVSPQEQSGDLRAEVELLASLPTIMERATPQERHKVYLRLFERVLLADHEIKKITPAPNYVALFKVMVIHQSGPGGHPAPLRAHWLTACLPWWANHKKAMARSRLPLIPLAFIFLSTASSA